MIIVLLNLLLALIMLAAAKKPYNPNYDPKTAEDINWNRTDLLSFLDNIHNVPLNDITTSGKDIKFYQTATKAQIAAELIKTINLTHYKLLTAVKDVIDYNIILLNKTQTTNNSLDLCEKKINKLTTQTQRNNFLLLQIKMAHMRPDPIIKDLKNDICQVNELPTVINTDESIHQIIDEQIPTIIIGATDHTIAQTKQIYCATANSCAQIRNQNILINEPQSNGNDLTTKFHSTQDSIKTSSPNKPIMPSITMDTSESSHKHSTDETEHIKSTELSIEPLIIHNALDNIQSKCIPQASVILSDTNILPINDGSCTTANSGANKRGQIITSNQPQIDLETTQSNCASANSCAVTRDTKKIIIKTQLKSKKKKNKIKIKIKKKKKKINNKNNYKRNNKKKIKHKKNPKMNPTAKNIISDYGLEQIVRDHFTDDDFQDWMNIRLFNPQYTATIHYENTYGATAINGIIQSHKNDQ